MWYPGCDICGVNFLEAKGIPGTNEIVASWELKPVQIHWDGEETSLI